MRKPGTFDLDLYRGDSYTFRVRVWQDARANFPFDFTGATINAEVRDKTGGLKVVELRTLLTVPNIIDVFIDPDMYETMPPKGVWDLQVTYPDDSVLTVLKGAVVVTGDVTDSIAMEAR